jgi:hypothetical protein
MVRMKLLAGLAVLAAAALVAQTAAQTPRPTDLDGHPVDPLQAPEARAVVLLFVRSDCPISNRYAPEIRRIYDRFAGRGVVFWLVYPDPQASVAEIRRHLAEYRYPGRVLQDPAHALVKLAHAEVTPEAAVFAPGRRLVYHGRIDDLYVDWGRTRPAPTTHDLVAALEATLAGRPVPVAATRAVGCFLADLH